MKKTQKSKLAIIALLLSIIGFPSIVFFYLSPYACIVGPIVVLCAIICGHLAKRKIKRKTEIAGKKRAVTALIIGYIYIAIFTAFLIHFYFLAKAMMDSYRMFNMERVIGLCNKYISDNDGGLPESFKLLYKDYYKSKALISPVTKDKSKPSYKLVLKGNIKDYPDKSNTVMIAEVVPNKRENKLFVYLDGRIEIISDDKKTTNIYSRYIPNKQ